MTLHLYSHRQQITFNYDCVLCASRCCFFSVKKYNIIYKRYVHKSEGNARNKSESEIMYWIKEKKKKQAVYKESQSKMEAKSICCIKATTSERKKHRIIARWRQR